MKRFISLILTGALLAGVIITANPVQAQAAYSCTYDIINDANSKIAQAQQNYALAQAEEANYKVAFEAVKSLGPSSLAYLQAAAAYESAMNRTKYAAGQIANAQAYLANIKGREAYEDNLLTSIDLLHGVNNLQLAKSEADGAQEIANAVIAQINNTKTAIAGYQQQLATCPSVQAQLDALNVQLASLIADYNSKQAVANQKLAAYQAILASGAGAGYTQKYIDAYYNYERNVEINHDVTKFDFYTNTHVAPNCPCEPEQPASCSGN